MSYPRQQRSVVSLAWQRYLHQLQTRPLRTKALTSATLAGLSDVIAQRLIRNQFAGHNFRRTLLLFLYGLIWSGPSAHFWQRFLEILFRGRADLITVIKKVILDQCSYGPVCNILFMSYATMVLEGRTVNELSNKIRCDYPLVQLNGWKIWPLASLINYKFVPLQFRVLFINCVAVCWAIFLLLSSRRGAATGSPGQLSKQQTSRPGPVTMKHLKQ